MSLSDIIKNVAGIDINPIATLITKANYLIAISDLIEDSEEITLPVYTKDCLKSPDLFNYDKIEKYDVIMGNPPWVVMRSMRNKEYQNFLKKEVLNYHLLENKDVHLFTQMELATLFFCKCADLYLKREGIIAFVMPRSVLAGTIHHINFRKFKKPPIKLVKILISRTNSMVAVKTSSEIYRMVKEPWKIVLEGGVEDDFLYATLLAWEIIPFGHIKLHPVILPIRELFNGCRLLNSNELQGTRFTGAEEWLKKAEEIWCKRRTEKSEKRFPCLLDRLNYNNLLTIQNSTKRYAVLYNATGTNLFSCIIDKSLLPCFMTNGKEAKPKGFIVDVKTWFFETENEMEAYYLSAIFNSELINRIIKPYKV
jgi:hypothetical protein